MSAAAAIAKRKLRRGMSGGKNKKTAFVSGRSLLDESVLVGTVWLGAQFPISLQAPIVFFSEHAQSIEGVVQHLLFSAARMVQRFFDAVEYGDASGGDALRQFDRIELHEGKLVEFFPRLRAGSAGIGHVNTSGGGATILLL